MDTDTGGYFAVARGVFDHVLFKENRPLTRLEAWLWLIARAAWKDKGLRRRHAVVHLGRGQLAASIRTLGTLWQWPKSNVERFLRECEAEGLISLALRSGTKSWTKNRPQGVHQITCITICNYDKYQRRGLRNYSKPAQTPNPSVGHFDFGEPWAATASANEATKPQKPESSRSAEEGRLRKPRHGAKGRGMIWFDHDTDDWKIYADDYRNVRGAEKFPESRIGGRGNWFYLMGEAQRGKRA